MNTSQAPRSPRLAGVAAGLVLALGLAACGDRNDDRTVGQKVDAAVERTEQAAANMKDEARQGMANAESEARSAGNTVGEKAARMGETIADKVDDATITASVNADLARDPDLSAIRINVDTKDGVVTLTGPAPSASAKDRAADIARGVKGVASVNNNLEVRAG